MNATMLRLIRLMLIALWVAIGVNVFLPFPDPWFLALNVLGLFMVAAHAVECLLFTPRVRAHGTDPVLDYLQIFLFGYFHACRLQPDRKDD